MTDNLDGAVQARVHLLDVGQDQYGDAVLCQFGGRVVLIDGAHPGDDKGSPGHPSIPEQIGDLLGTTEPHPIDLLIVTHAHQDHIGCLPKLVKEGVLDVKWALVADPGLGWGRSSQDSSDDGLDEKTRTLAAALREEIREVKTDNRDEIEKFLVDAVTLETRYSEMIETLELQGTKVVRLGRNSSDSLVEEFKDIKLKIIGPSENHLLMCAEIINAKTRDDISLVSDLMAKDAEVRMVDAYEQLARSMKVSAATDDLDAVSRPGPAINLQSIITQFDCDGRKFLFAGDFQFAKPEVNDSRLELSVQRLRTKIRQEAPYSFVKLSHHGSYNSFSEEILDELGGTAYFGLCAGEESTHHPSRKVLELLDENRDRLTWARTDHNGQVTFEFRKGSDEPFISMVQGELDDAKPNDSDIGIPRPIVVAKPVPKGSQIPKTPVAAQEEPTTVTAEAANRSGFVEIQIKIPNDGTRARFSGDFVVEVERTDNRSNAKPPGGPQGEAAAKIDSSITIGGGRPGMKDLLFVTSADALAQNIGVLESQQVLSSLNSQNIPLFDRLPAGLSDSGESSRIVCEVLQSYPNVKGVVLLGGYDVVPAQILDCLPTDLRAQMPGNDDPDNFVVWSDDVYGDRDGDGLPEIPVSRIPDGKSASLVTKAISAVPPSSGDSRFGIRNIARPFANPIFESLAGSERLLISKKAVFDQQPAIVAEASRIYFMLHGDYVDSSRFWGEGTPSNREAVNVNNIPNNYAGVVFTGCCWGALTVNTPAGMVDPGRPYGQKTVESSIALSFLDRGAQAFVGCTGAHYSPTESPFNYFGGPMHAAFWRNLANGLSPAESLYRAKIEYVAEMPHGRTGPLQSAIEYKILRQYTCLGLGW